MSPHVDRNAPDVTLNLPPASLTQGERAELRRVHGHYRTLSWPEQGLVCLYCSEFEDGSFIPYPCPVIRTLDALEAAERERDKLVQTLRELVSDASGGYDVLALQDIDLIRDIIAAHDARRKGADHA